METFYKRFLTLLLVGFISGCGGNKPYPAERLVQPAGGFSYVTPAGWYRTKLAGIAYVIVSTDADYGVRPNIYVDRVAINDSLQDAAVEVISQNKSNFSSYAVTNQMEFATASGLAGLKITAVRKNRDSLPLALYHYLFDIDGRLVTITCNCAGPVRDKYEGIFDQAMKSLQSEKQFTPPSHQKRGSKMKVDKRQLEKSLGEFKTDAVLKSVQPLSITKVDQMTKKITAGSGMPSLPSTGGDGGYACDFHGHSLSMFLEEYSRLTGKSIVQEAKEPAEGITFKLERAMPVEEAVMAMELFLLKKNIVIVADEGSDRFKAVERVIKPLQ